MLREIGPPKTKSLCSWWQRRMSDEPLRRFGRRVRFCASWNNQGRSKSSERCTTFQPGRFRSLIGTTPPPMRHNSIADSLETPTEDDGDGAAKPFTTAWHDKEYGGFGFDRSDKDRASAWSKRN